MKPDEKQLQSNGVWSQWQADQYHKHSPKLAKFLTGYLDLEWPVYDFGCGQGFYIHELAKAGFKCKGIEGFPLNNFLHNEIIIHDLRYPIVSRGPLGQVLSFEVGEHIPQEFEQTFLDTLTRNCANNLIISWATPGQPGVGHINCRSHEYIIDQIMLRRFNWNEDATEEIRKHVDKECDWLERNLLVFDRI